MGRGRKVVRGGPKRFTVGLGSEGRAIERREKPVDDDDEENEESGEEESDDEAPAPARPSAVAQGKKPAQTQGDDDEDEDGEEAPKSLIDVQNPNRVVQKQSKLSSLGTEQKPELSRREREELEKQAAKERYMKLHAAGKTDEAKKDLARLAQIRAERDAAAKKREEERIAKEKEQAAKIAQRKATK